MITPDHEVLTEAGWIAISDVNHSDKIATLCLEHNKLEYHTPVVWDSQEVLDQNMIVIRHNRAELTCRPETKLIAKYSKTAAWQTLVSNNLRSVDFYLRLYLSEVVVKPINVKLVTAAYSGPLMSPVVTNGTFMVRKNGKITWVCCGIPPLI